MAQTQKKTRAAPAAHRREQDQLPLQPENGDGADAARGREDAAVDAGRRGVFDAKFAILSSLLLWGAIFLAGWLLILIF